MKINHCLPVFALSFSFAMIPLGAQAGGLSAKKGQCPTERAQSLEAIAIGIAATSVSNLVGATVDRVVNYLKSERSRSYSVSLPINSIGDVLDQGDLAFPLANVRRNRQCLFVSSESLDDYGVIDSGVVNKLRESATLFAVISFRSSGLNPSVFLVKIEEWNYKSFLDRSCPLFRNCRKRDVVVRLLFNAPTTPDGKAATNASAIGVALSGVSANDVNSVFRPQFKMPWFQTNVTSGPSNVTFEIVETSKPGDFAKALADALNSQKTPLQNQAGAWVTSTLQNTPNSEVQMAALARLKAADADFSSYQAAHAAALSSFDSIGAAPDDDARRQAISKYRVLRQTSILAEQQAEASYRLAGLRMEKLQPLPAI